MPPLFRWPEPELTYEQTVSACTELVIELLRRAALRDAQKLGKRPSSVSQTPNLGDRVVGLLTKAGPLTPKELRAMLHTSPMSLTRALSKLSTSGRVRATGNTKGRKYALT
jgi:predicted HTH transcriptional regulator